MASAFDDPLAPSPCEQCGNATEGTMICSVQDRVKNLCQGCFQDMPQARREDIGDPEWVCNIHSDSKVAIFCETCKLGCCKECAVDVHQGHKVVNVFKLVAEIRCYLTEQLQEVGVRAEALFELQRKIESLSEKIKEAPKLVNKVVDEIMNEVAQNLEKEILQILWQIHLGIIHQERGDTMQKLAKERADLDIQRIDELQRGISTALLEDAEKRRCKLQKAELKLLVGQQACESANLQLKSMLESTPEKLVREGRQLGSLVKASSAFQFQNEVLESCKEVEADLPQLKKEKDLFFLGFGHLSKLLTIVLTMLCISVVFCYAYEARGVYRDEYNRLLSFEWETCYSLFLLCSTSTIQVYHAISCFVLMLLLAFRMYRYDCPITRNESYMKKLKSFFKIVRLGLESWLRTVLFLLFMSFPLYIFQVESVSANIVSIMSFLQSFVFLYDMGHSKTFKDYCDYLKLHQF
eukprot:XP_011673907.1 PREDICTED: uncharacterized protein LOC105442931 isoform X1 [Strongylocentrotus purpuratus]